MANQNLQLSIEITSKCNSGCLDCCRYVKGTDTLNPTVELKNMSFEMFKNIFDEEVRKNLNKIIFTGTYGENTIHPQFIEFVNYVADVCENKIIIEMETNGGTRNPDWWREYGLLLKERFHEKSHTIFSMDGTDDKTHQMYRRGVSLDRCFANARAFAENSRVVWQMIEFEHNKHQFEEAKEIAEKEGWTFRKRRSRQRFIQKNDDGKVHNSKSKVIVEETKRKRYSKENIIASSKDHEVWESIASEVDADYENTTEIICEWNKQNKWSIDYDGKVWQCCYFSSFYHPHFLTREYQKENPDVRIMKIQHKENLDYYENQYEFDWNNLSKHTMSEIMNHRFFKQDLPESFNNRVDDDVNPRIKRCSKFCGAATRKIDRLINVES